MDQENKKSDAAILAPLSRRRFLLLSGGAIGVAFSWRFFSPAKGAHYEGLTYLSQQQARILVAVYQVMAPETTTENQQEVILFLDDFISRLDKMQRLQLSAALMLLEHTPLLFHGFLPRFTRLDSERQVRCLNGWRNGGPQRSPLYSALKELIFMGHYSMDWSWEAIGYGGPLIEVDRPPSPRDHFYEGLLAKGSKS